jgi:hypothetical protein
MATKLMILAVTAAILGGTNAAIIHKNEVEVDSGFENTLAEIAEVPENVLSIGHLWSTYVTYLVFLDTFRCIRCMQ